MRECERYLQGARSRCSFLCILKNKQKLLILARKAEARRGPFLAIFSEWGKGVSDGGATDLLRSDAVVFAVV